MPKKKLKIRIAISLVIIAAIAAIAANTSNLAYNIAQQREILLGHYTESKAITLILALLAGIIALFAVWKKPKEKTPQQKLHTIFKAVTLAVSIAVSLLVFDIAMRVLQRDHYVKAGKSYHRRPNSVFNRSFTDAPVTKFSYPTRNTNYKKRDYTLTVDSIGFRNTKPVEKCDWLIIGDSFAEGSNVSDNEVWWNKIAQAAGISVYNLGMSGGTPATYYETLEKFGLEKSPKNVICMIYEGNDFRKSNFDNLDGGISNRDPLLKTFFKHSPLRQMLKKTIRNSLAPIGANRFQNDAGINSPKHQLYPVAWLPIAVPANSDNYYTFDLKRLLQHWLTKEDFENSLGCKQTKRFLGEINNLCKKNNINLTVAYAPDKPNILLEEILARIPEDQLRAFMALKAKNLPETITPDMLRERTCVQENMVKAFCESNQIDFISLTEPLRGATESGNHTYFTYDQHWSVTGHEIVADFLTKQLHLDRSNASHSN